jgi:diguanylate cyclase (GGDEF)-like protein/PAS domain S-box-containing protein
VDSIHARSQQAAPDDADDLFAVSLAAQGEAAAQLHAAALSEGRPFQVAFIDMRMPPGWDGLRTALALRAQDPGLYIVISTAFADYDVAQMQAALGHDLVLLRKPFTREEVYQLARTLCQSWQTRRRLEHITGEMEQRVLARTAELNKRIAQQQALAEIATRCVELGAAEYPDDAVAWALARIGRITGADMACLFRLDDRHAEADGSYSMTHEWSALGMPALQARFQAVPANEYGFILGHLRRGTPFRFPRMALVSEEMNDLAQRLNGLIEAFLIVPFSANGEVCGFLGIGFNRAGPEWDAHDEALLRTAGHILFRTLEMYETKQRLTASEATLAATAEFVAHAPLDAYCQDMVRHAAVTLGFDYVHIARLIPGQLRVETHAAWLDGALIANWSYDLARTPCNEVLHESRRCIASGVQALYPGDDDLKNIGAEGYIGEPIVGSSGEVYGLIVGITRAPLRNGDVAQANLRILAARTSAVYEQRDAMEKLRQEKEALQDSEARVRAIADNANMVVFMKDLAGRYQFVNRRWLQLFHASEEQILGKTDLELFPENFAQAYRQHDHLVAEQGRTLEIEEQAPHDDGMHTYQTVKFPLHKASGEIYATAGMAIDISERKRAEIALRDSEIKFHTMVDWTYDWEYWIFPDGHFHYMTPSAERITGYRVAEFEQDPALLDAIVSAEDQPVWRQHTRHHLAEGVCEEIAELDLRIVHKQGELRWVTHICRPVFDHAGRYLGRRVTVRDITARKAAEAQIRHLAYFDSLTSLPNRRLLMDRLEQALIAGKRSQQWGALLILDLDDFKSLNDTRGHDVGDQLLIEVARRLSASVREEDTIARLGGDEFVVILDGLELEESAAAERAMQVAEKMRLALNLPYALNAADPAYHSTPSIGLTLFRGQETTPDVLLKQADVALYRAKDAGRNTVRRFVA